MANGNWDLQAIRLMHSKEYDLLARALIQKTIQQMDQYIFLEFVVATSKTPNLSASTFVK